LEKRKIRYSTSWEEFSEAIRTKYLPPNAVENLQDRLHKMQQKGTVIQYSSEFRRTLSLIGNYDESNAFLLYKNGLKPLLRMQVNIAKCTDIDEAEQVALHTEAAMQREETRPPPATPKLTRPTGAFLRPSPGPSTTGGPTKLTPSEKEYLRKNNGCYRCRQLGHLSTQCPTYPSTPTATPSAPPQLKPQPSRQSLRLNNAETATQTATGFTIRQ
jgi:Retrotransposon gag protein/Zinc knuckle